MKYMSGYMASDSMRDFCMEMMTVEEDIMRVDVEYQEKDAYLSELEKQLQQVKEEDLLTENVMNLKKERENVQFQVSKCQEDY